MTGVEGNASIYQVYPLSRITGEGRAEVLRASRPGFEQEGAGGRGGEGETGGATQSICADSINPLREQI